MKGTIVANGNFEVFPDGTILKIKLTGEKENANITYKKIGGFVYPVVSCMIGGKQKKYYVHRLIAEAFLPNPKSYNYVTFKNGDATDFKVDNLEWGKRKFRSKNEKEDIECPICGSLIKKGNKCRTCDRNERAEKGKIARKKSKLRKIQNELGNLDLGSVLPKYRRAVELRLQGVSLEEIGNDLGVTKERARQIIKLVKDGGGRMKSDKEG